MSPYPFSTITITPRALLKWAYAYLCYWMSLRLIMERVICFPLGVVFARFYGCINNQQYIYIVGTSVDLDVGRPNSSLKDVKRWITNTGDLLLWGRFVQNQSHFLEWADNRRILQKCTTEFSFSLNGCLSKTKVPRLSNNFTHSWRKNRGII